MGEIYFWIKGPLGDTLTIETTDDGQYELVTEFDRKVASEAYVGSLRRDAKFWRYPRSLSRLFKSNARR